LSASGSRHQLVSDSQATPGRGSFPFAVPDIPQQVSRIVLKSAFRPPAVCPKWTRNIKMVSCSFMQTMATYDFKNGLDVHFETLEITKEIEIAANWERVGDDGYIGEGFTKRGIYVCWKFYYSFFHVTLTFSAKARFMGKEYVLTQPIDPYMEKDAVKSVLRAEFALLCIGNALKHEFDEHARESGVVTVPSEHIFFLYFN
jgi:hypothetical protein